jgi:hypothetical protein
MIHCIKPEVSTVQDHSLDPSGAQVVVKITTEFAAEFEGVLCICRLLFTLSPNSLPFSRGALASKSQHRLTSDKANLIGENIGAMHCASSQINLRSLEALETPHAVDLNTSNFNQM